jgi:hypothetical protein
VGKRSFDRGHANASLYSLHRRVLAVLHLDPIGASPAAIGAIDALGDQTLKPHIAGSPEQVGADLALLEWRDENAVGPSREINFEGKLRCDQQNTDQDQERAGPS